MLQVKEQEGPSAAKQPKVREVPYRKLVLVEHFGTDGNSVMLMDSSTRYAGIKLEYEFQKGTGNVTCLMFLNDIEFVQASASCKRFARRAAADAAVKILRKKCYTIKIKKRLSPNVHLSDNPEEWVGESSSFGDLEPERQEREQEEQQQREGEKQQQSRDEESARSSGSTAGEPQVSPRIKLKEDNIGMKLMKMMGWSGGGLGKEQQGIVEPVTVWNQLSRQGLGLGLKVGKIPIRDFKMKCREIIRAFQDDPSKPELVFTSEFSNNERAIIHQIARSLGAKSRSYGPKDNRTLVISRSIHPAELVTELLKLGGSTEKYELVEPESRDD